ncbi:hypothetical protein Tco_0280757 [Tanacetum coccineum]
MKNAATVQGCDDGEIIQSTTTNYEALDKIDNQLETLSMNNAYFVKGCNDGEPEFIEQKPKVHARNKKLKNRCLLLIGPDGIEIPAWTEANYGVFVYSKLWESLLGIGKFRSGWWSDMVCNFELDQIFTTKGFLQFLVAEGSSETTTERYMENYKNVSQDIRDQLNAEAKAVQIILTGIDNDIYSTVDACPNACEMWKAIERLKQGVQYNVQDLETNLYCHVINHQVNVQFLLQLQPEWQRFVTLVKQSQELKTVSYHKLYDILKQHQNEVNEIRAERLARTANPLALVAQQQPVYHPQNHPTQNTKYSSTRSQQSTRNRGKAICYSLLTSYIHPELARLLKIA